MTFIVPQPVPMATIGEGLNYLEIARNSGTVGITVLAILLVASAVCWAIARRRWASNISASPAASPTSMPITASTPKRSSKPRKRWWRANPSGISERFDFVQAGS